MQLFPMSSALEITFPNGQQATAIQVQTRAALPNALHGLGLESEIPVLVIIGGASNLSPADYKRLEKLFNELLAPLAEKLGMVVVDGGTDAGVMQLMGLARTKQRASFPLVGVAPIEKVHLPGKSSPIAAHHLEPHHSHFLLVPGNKWGDESPWMAEVASLLSGTAPSVTILMNGGNISLKDVEESVAEERMVVVIAGTGRLADQIASAMRNPQSNDQARLLPVLERGCFKLFELSKSTRQMKPFLERYFLYSRQPSLQSKLNASVECINPM